MLNPVITRFAPSPTGFLHIGGARTALFNWLYSKGNNGQFFLRIEDTDKERSTQAAIDAIVYGMEWLGLLWDGEIVFQSKRVLRHQEIANSLLNSDKAYRCYMTQQEIEDAKIANPKARFRSVWRDKRPSVSNSRPYTIRLRVPTDGSTVVDDIVHGKVSVPNDSLDDMVLLRSDGTPTYMLAVVVDDYDMGINHVIRGDDHFTNTFRQSQLYDALNWQKPIYAHIPLIHGNDGAKLSKRHGALGIEAYRDMGYLPNAMCNYLLRLGWSKDDIELIVKEDAAKIFQLKNLVKSPAQFNFDKLNHINAHYIQQSNNKELLTSVLQRLNASGLKISEDSIECSRILHGMNSLKLRAVTLEQLTEMSLIYVGKKEPSDAKSLDIMAKYHSSTILGDLVSLYEKCDNWNIEELMCIGDDVASSHNIKNAVIMQILRAFVIGTFESPGVYEVMSILGKEEVLKRMKG